jgi:hypothetical protein
VRGRCAGSFEWIVAEKKMLSALLYACICIYVEGGLQVRITEDRREDFSDIYVLTVFVYTYKINRRHCLESYISGSKY